MIETKKAKSDLKVPKFETEAEEAKWWYDNEDLVADEFVKAAREGRLRVGSVRARLEGRELEFLPPMEIDDDQVLKD
jgi:hypothetical protein